MALSARGAAVASILHQVTGGTASLWPCSNTARRGCSSSPCPPTFVARDLKDIGSSEDAIVAAILRGDQAIVPRGDDRIEPGDRILVFCTRAAADRVHAYFTGAGD